MKKKLRKELFNELLKVDNGISIDDLLKETKFIDNTWKKFHIILSLSVKEIKDDDYIDSVKLLDNSLIIKTQIGEYFIIEKNSNNNYMYYDYENKVNIDNATLLQNKSPITSFEYNGLKKELLDYYEQNKDILNLPKTIYYQLNIGFAKSYLVINIAEGINYLGFETEDQYLYEHIFLDRNLNPLPLQDFQNKMSKDEIENILLNIKNITIPKDIIPKELCNILNISKEKVIKKN